jgi:cell division protein FtsB
MQDKIVEKLKRVKNHPYWQQFRDIRAIGLVLFLIIMLLIVFHGVKAIQQNYELQKKIATLKQQVAVQKLQNKNLKLENQYYNSRQYLELAARRNFGKGKKGETELLVPKKVALTYAKPLPGTSKKQDAASHKPLYQKNFEAWMNFFLHRQGTP